MKKKVLAWLLAVMMVGTTFSTTAYAEDAGMSNDETETEGDGNTDETKEDLNGEEQNTEDDSEGNNSGEASLTNLSDAGATIMLSESSYTYDGTAKEPEVTVTIPIVSSGDETSENDSTDDTNLADDESTEQAVADGDADDENTEQADTSDGEDNETDDTTVTLTVGTDYTVAYSNNINAGTATVTVTGMGGYEGELTEDFIINKAEQELAADASVVLAVGETTVLSISAKTPLTYSVFGDGAVDVTDGSGSASDESTETDDETDTETETEYTADTDEQEEYETDTDLLTEEETGSDGEETVKEYTIDLEVTGVSAGTAIITVSAGEDDNYEEASIDISVEVVETASFSPYIVTLSETQYTYDGTAKEPDITVTAEQTADDDIEETEDSNEAVVLAEGVDYTVAYSNNINAGTATVTITGMGKYTGIMTESFIIAPADLSSGEMALAKTSYSYNGSAREPSVTIEYGDTELTAGTDYTVCYYNNTEPGKAVTLVVGKGNYTGVLSETFTIILGTPKISSLSNTSSGVKIKWGAATGATGYYIYRSTSANGTYTKIATVKDSSKDTYTYTNANSGTDKVSGGKTYYYKIIAYRSSSDTTVKGSASSKKSIRYLSCAAISGFTNTSTGITVKWGKVSGAGGYYIYRKSGSGSYTQVKKVTSGSTVKWTDTSVANGETYSYRVQPYYGGSVGTYKAKSTTYVSTVKITGLSSTSPKRMTIKWSKNSKASGYEVYYSTSKSFSSNTRAFTAGKASTVSQKVKDLTGGKTYYVKVRAYKTINGKKYYSAWSSVKAVKVKK